MTRTNVPQPRRWWPKAAKRAHADLLDMVEAHYGDVQRIAGEKSLVNYSLDREKELHNITKAELERTQEQLTNAVELAKGQLMTELEQEFARVREARQRVVQSDVARARKVKIAEAVAEDAVSAAVIRLHKEFSRQIAADPYCERIMGTIPAFSVSTQGGARTMVDPDGPVARAVLRATAQHIAGMEVNVGLVEVPDDLPEVELPAEDELVPDPEVLKALDEIDDEPTA